MTSRKPGQVWNGQGWVDAAPKLGCSRIIGYLVVICFALFVIVQIGSHL